MSPALDHEIDVFFSGIHHGKGQVLVVIAVRWAKIGVGRDLNKNGRGIRSIEVWTVACEDLVHDD